MDYSQYYAAFGLVPSDLSDERKRQLGVIFTEAAKTAGGTIVKEATKILQEEAQKRGISSGTPGTTAHDSAQQRIEELARLDREAAEKKRQQRQTWLIGGISVVILGMIGVVVAQLRKNR